MRIAYFDCLSGISGDMTLGALIDAGASADTILDGIRSLGLGELQLQCEEVRKCGFRAIQVEVLHPPEHAHRHLHQIEAMIDGAERITPAAKELAKRIFQALGAAEAKVHGTTIQKVHFHEVGAVDSIADIVGTAIALDQLGIDAVEASPVPTGSGEITIAHGRVSVPAPATAELLLGIPIAPSPVQAELTTPTGAAILHALGRRFGPLPGMVPAAIGYGAGQRDLEGQANVLRVVIGEFHAAPLLADDLTTAPAEPPQGLTDPSGSAGEAPATGSAVRPLYEQDDVVSLETNLDNTTAEDLADCVQRLEQAGALDVYQTACLMKKGRMGVQLTVLAPLELTSTLEQLILQHTRTLGVRRQHLGRTKLLRREAVIETPYGPLEGKEALRPDGRWDFAVEYEAAARLAREQNLSLAAVRQLVASGRPDTTA